MKQIPAYYWDSCVFIAYFNDERAQHNVVIDHIGQFLEEAKHGKCAIYTSSVTIAEILEPTLVKGGHFTFSEFLKDFQGSIYLIDADPNTMATAARLRSQRYGDANGNSRSLSTPDAIHLATAINLSSTYNVSIDQFHTFDAGRTRGLEGGRGIPMLNFENWTHPCGDNEDIKRVNKLKRAKPEHSSPTMFQ